MKQIIAVSDAIARCFQPERIILFGSYAVGTPRVDSDVDLLVVMPYEGHPAYKAVEILNHVAPPFAIDLLVRSPSELEQRVKLGDFFLRQVLHQGRQLYASADAGVDK